MPKQIGSIDLKKSGYVLESKTQYAISNTGSAPAPSSIAWTDVMPTIAELSVDSTNKLYARQCNLINGTFVPGPPYDAHMLDGLALFTNTVANKDVNNNYTSINGSTITTGKIQDTSHKNFIQVAADSTYPAGHMEFKDTADWTDAHQGLQWDSARGELNIKGNISANSLTIINGNSSYDGTAAINISGYDVEIVKDSVDVQEGVSVYLYPVLYHNGEKVPDYIQSTDTSVDSSKTYYTRSGSAGSYVYTEVTNPSGNPSQIPYYEKQIDYSHFLWYQDDSEIGTAGDANNKGRYLATYSHNYRVTYEFDDGAVGGGTEVQTRYVDPEKYITKVNDNEITIHPESYQNVSSYMRLGTSGLNLYNSSGNSIAQYGSTARVGLDNSSRFLMNNSSLQAYDSNNVKYFEVSSSGLTWGSQAAATTQQVSNLSSQLAGKANTSDVNQVVSDLEDAIDLKADSADVPTSVTDLSDGADYSTTTQMNTAIGAAETRAAKTATSYISTIDMGGIKVHDAEDEDNYAKIDATGLEVFNDIDNISTSVAKFGATSRIGESTSTSPHIDLTNKFMQISNNEKSYFGAGFVNQSASLIRIPFEAKECEGTSTLTLTTNCTIASINEIRGYTYAAKLIPLVPNLNYTFVPGTNTVTLLNLDDLFIESSYEFYIDYNTAQFASLQGNYAPVLDEYNSFFGSTYIPEHKIAGVISVRIDGEPVTSSNYNVNQDGSISFTGTGTNDSHFIHISYVTNDSLFAVTGEDQQGVIGVNSVSFGKDNQVSGGYSGAIGKGLTTASSYQFAIGKYNKCEQDSLFMVGNGDAPYSAKLCLKLTNANNHPVLTLDLSQVSETLFGGSFFFTTPDQYKWFNTIPWYDPDDPIIDVTDAMRVDNQDITFNTHAAVDSIEVIAIMLRQRMDEGEQNIYLNEDENIIPATNTLTTVYATVAALESNVFEVKTDGEVLIKEQPVEGFVVEQGESGIWTYRKWNNWTVDCWGRWEETITNYGSWNNMTSYHSSTKQLPFEIYDAVPTYSAKISNGYVFGCSILGAYANPLSEISLYASASSSGSQSVIWTCDIKGKWY